MSINSLFIEKKRPRHPMMCPPKVFCLTFGVHFIHPSTRKPGRQRPGEIACGQWDNYRTIFEDLDAIYLFVLQLKD